MAYTTRTVRLKIPGGRFCARCFGRTASKGRGKMNSIKAFLKAKRVISCLPCAGVCGNHYRNCRHPQRGARGRGPDPHPKAGPGGGNRRMGFTGCCRKPARTGCSCGDSAAIARAVSCGVCIVILAAGGWAVWQRLRRDWQLCCFVRAAGNLAARWLER